MEKSNEVKTWADIMDTPEKRTVEEVIAKSLKERDNEEKERQNRRRNIIVFELPESKKFEPEDWKEEDIKKFVGFCKGIIKINFDHTMIECIIRLGKAKDDKHQPLLITLKEEDNKEASWLHAELFFVLVSMWLPQQHLVSICTPHGIHVETMWCPVETT